MPDKFSGARDDIAFTFGTDAILWTPADIDLPANVKGVKFTASTTITFKNVALATRTGFPVSGGVLMEIVPRRITAVGSGECWLIVA